MDEPQRNEKNTVSVFEQTDGARVAASAGPQLEVPVPGRFSVLVGANNAGKTTVSDAAAPALMENHRIPVVGPRRTTEQPVTVSD